MKKTKKQTRYDVIIYDYKTGKVESITGENMLYQDCVDEEGEYTFSAELERGQIMLARDPAVAILKAYDTFQTR